MTQGKEGLCGQAWLPTADQSRLFPDRPVTGALGPP